MSTGSVLYFPKQSKKTPRKAKPKDKTEPQPKATVMQWIRNGFAFPGKVRP